MTIDKNLLLKAKAIAKNIFGFEVQTIVNNQAEEESEGEYDFKSHSVIIYEKCIEELW